jgi:hypothetical protein
MVVTQQLGRSGAAAFLDFVDNAARWQEEHADEIRVYRIWSAVTKACGATGLYAPPHREAWLQIADADQAGADSVEMEALILALYGPGGAAHEELRAAVRDADLLQTRRGEVQEVLDSFAGGRHYVAICGTFPLVEFVFTSAAGRWRQPDKHPLRKRLHQPLSALTPEQRNALFLHRPAVETLRSVKALWKSRQPPPGAVTDELNRQWALHGTARGWDTADNAVWALMVLGAAARVAEALLAPQ